MREDDPRMVEARRLLAEAIADPDADEQVKAARNIRALTLIREVLLETKAESLKLRAAADEAIAALTPLFQEVDGQRWRDEEMRALSDRAEAGALGEDEAQEALTNITLARDAGRLVD